MRIQLKKKEKKPNKMLEAIKRRNALVAGEIYRNTGSG
jgi:hypothetical protein